MVCLASIWEALGSLPTNCPCPKPKSMSKHLKAHIEMHSFDNMEHLPVVGIGHIVMKTSTVPVTRLCDLEIKILVSLSFTFQTGHSIGSDLS